MTPVVCSAVAALCRETPPAAIQSACALLSGADMPASSAIARLAGRLPKPGLMALDDALWRSSISARELAFALECASAAYQAGREDAEAHLVWTGPDTEGATPRETLPQMLEMIGKARERLLLVTFAAFKASPVMEALTAAAARGVRLMIVVETAEDSGGQLSHDAADAFPSQLLQSGCLWHWPNECRPASPLGRPGKLHAKCLAIDGSELLISSANLTDDAMERNIETGLRCTHQGAAGQLFAKFQALADEGIIRRLQPLR